MEMGTPDLPICQAKAGNRLALSAMLTWFPLGEGLGFRSVQPNL